MEYIGIAAAGTQALSAILGGLQGRAKSQADEKASAYNAQVDAQQAKIASEVGASKEAATRRSSADYLGNQAASIAESGVGVTSGSAQDIMRQSSINAEMDALNTRYGAALERKNALDQYGLDTYGEKVAGYNKNASLYTGFVGAGTAALTSFAHPDLSGPGNAVNPTMNNSFVNWLKNRGTYPGI